MPGERKWSFKGMACDYVEEGQDSYYEITLGNLGVVVGALGDTQAEKALLERALWIQETHYEQKHVEVAKTLNNLGNVLLS